MGKVTFYYLRHEGHGAFDNPGFMREFREADVVDLETGARVSPRTKMQFRAIARGDRNAYERLMSHYNMSYDRLQDPRILYNMDVIDLLFDSGKKVDFEGKQKARSRRPTGRGLSRHYAKISRIYPGIGLYLRPGERAKIIPETDAKWRGHLENYYGEIGKLTLQTIVRSFADSERIARQVRIKPGQHRLVIRGLGHWEIAPFLEKALEKENADIRIMHMPMPAGARGVPPPTGTLLIEKVKKGKPITVEDLIRSRIRAMLFKKYVGVGWDTAKAASQSEVLADGVNAAEIRGLVAHPREIRGYIDKMDKGEIFTPWWVREKIDTSSAKYKKRWGQRIRP